MPRSRGGREPPCAWRARKEVCGERGAGKGRGRVAAGAIESTVADLPAGMHYGAQASAHSVRMRRVPPPKRTDTKEGRGRPSTPLPAELDGHRATKHARGARPAALTALHKSAAFTHAEVATQE